MLQTPDFGDERDLAWCAFCGGETGTRDHCPSRVLLDEPYPENLCVVPACSSCNAGFSADEQYLACLISCVLAGSTEPERVKRPKIRRILMDTPALRARIEESRLETTEGITFQPEHDRVTLVITKLAKGHALHELHLPCPEPPDKIEIFPLSLLSDSARYEFEAGPRSSPPRLSGWPEVGSRAMHRMAGVFTPPEYPWLVVQEGAYRFLATPDSRAIIQIVIQEYLGCYVQWD
jgi:hypothetical protein